MTVESLEFMGLSLYRLYKYSSPSYLNPRETNTVCFKIIPINTYELNIFY